MSDRPTPDQENEIVARAKATTTLVLNAFTMIAYARIELVGYGQNLALLTEAAA